MLNDKYPSSNVTPVIVPLAFLERFKFPEDTNILHVYFRFVPRGNEPFELNEMLSRIKI